MCVDVRITFAPKRLSHLFYVHRRLRQLERSFDDVWGIHETSRKFRFRHERTRRQVCSLALSWEESGRPVGELVLKLLDQRLDRLGGANRELAARMVEKIVPVTERVGMHWTTP